MKNNTLRKVSTLVETLTIALPLTLIPPAIAQSDVSRKLLDVTKAIPDGPISGNSSPVAFGGSRGEVSRFTGTALSTPTVALNSGALVIRNGSTARISVVGIPVKTVLIDAPPNSGIPSSTNDSVTHTNCTDPATSTENIVLSSTTGFCIGASRVEIARFNVMAVSPTTTVTSPLRGNITVSNNSIVRATLTDGTITTNSTKRGDSTSNNVRIGGIVIK